MGRMENGQLGRHCVMWDNRVTMHYAVSDYMPNYRCMNRITVVNDIRANKN
jgi:Probable taurine catabolism dioxygenase